MDKVSINLNTKMYGLKELDVISMFEENDRLLVVLNNDVIHKIKNGQIIFFRRHVHYNGEYTSTIDGAVYVLQKTKYKGRDAIYTTLPNKRTFRLKANYTNKINLKKTSGECVSDYDSYFDDANRYLMVKVGDNFVINDWLYYYTGDTEYFIIDFDRNHYVFQQDVYFVNEFLHSDYSIEAININGNSVGTLRGVSATFTGLPYTISKEDTLFCEEEGTCGRFDESGNPYNAMSCEYRYFPDNFSSTKIIFSAATAASGKTSDTFFDKVAYIIKNSTSFEPKFNPYYYYFMSGATKRAKMWEDPWWAEFESKNEEVPLIKRYFNNGDSRCMLGLPDYYWNIPISEFSLNDSSLGEEDGQNGDYVGMMIDGIIPDFVDMERVKYSPIIYSGNDDYENAKSINFYLHFRKREEKASYKSNIAEGGKYYKYGDSWNISQNSGNTIWWNGYNNQTAVFNQASFSQYMAESGKTSDLLGYLGFEDDDVFYRKSKVSMSFIRLSFYTSRDPIEQKLLYYSTIFLDETALFGRYMKQSQMKYGKYGEDEATPVVFFPDNSVSARVDTRICVKNEANRMSSSEGFNLYLFADDAEKTDEGKSSRTIYMKVEFNHAGNGKTIPMVMWPKNVSGQYRAMTTETFIHDLYIPVEIGYIDNAYKYSFPTADSTNGNIELVLFEPKLSYDENGNEVTGLTNSNVNVFDGWRREKR